MLLSRRSRYRYLAFFLAGAGLYALYVILLGHSSRSGSASSEEISSLDARLAHEQQLVKKQQRDQKQLLKGLGRPEVTIHVHKTVSDNRIHFKLTSDEKKHVDWCHGNLESPLSALRDTWQFVHEGGKDIYVYSAYYLSIKKQQIRVLAMYTGGTPRTLYCQLWYRRGKIPMRTAAATVHGLPEGKGRMYNSAYINCENPVEMIPYAVSVTFSTCQEPVNVLQVEPPPLSTASLSSVPADLKNMQIGLCVTPLNLNYDKVDQLLEYIEVTRLFGATHVTFYNYSTSSRVDKILAHYKNLGQVTVRQWHLPMKVHVWPIPPNYQEEIYYFGQIAALNDCLLRGRSRFNLLGFFDLDELAVPRQHHDWIEMMQDEQIGGPNLKRGLPKHLTFLNTFFKLEWPSDPLMAANKTVRELHAASLLKVRRESTIHGVGQRSKLLLDPRLVDVMGVHNVWQWTSDSEQEGAGRPSSVVPKELGLLHHYRFWDGMGEKQWVEDKNVLRRHREDVVRVLLTAREKLGADVMDAPPVRDEHHQYV